MKLRLSHAETIHVTPDSSRFKSAAARREKASPEPDCFSRGTRFLEHETTPLDPALIPFDLTVLGIFEID